jgi:hypothetical protein
MVGAGLLTVADHILTRNNPSEAWELLRELLPAGMSSIRASIFGQQFLAAESTHSIGLRGTIEPLVRKHARPAGGLTRPAERRTRLGPNTFPNGSPTISSTGTWVISTVSHRSCFNVARQSGCFRSLSVDHVAGRPTTSAFRLRSCRAATTATASPAESTSGRASAPTHSSSTPRSPPSQTSWAARPGRSTTAADVSLSRTGLSTPPSGRRSSSWPRPRPVSPSTTTDTSCQSSYGLKSPAVNPHTRRRRSRTSTQPKRCVGSARLRAGRCRTTSGRATGS